MPDPVLSSGIEIILWIQSLGELLLPPMQFLSFLGTEEFYLLIMPALYWCINPQVGFQVGLILLLSGSLNSSLKIVFHDPRPFWIDLSVNAYAFESSFGIPSGHAQNAVAIWGLLASLLRKTWVWGVSIALMILIGLSRLYLAVHFPTDVLVGWVIGLTLLGGFLILRNPTMVWFGGKSWIQQITVLLMFSILLIFIGWASISFVQASGWQIPINWIENASVAFPDAEPLEPFSLDGVITGAAAFFGLGAGWIWLSKQGGFHVQGSWAALLTRYALGLIGVLFLWGGLGAIFPDGENFPAYLFRFVRYGLIGAWISAFAPFLFVRFGLAKAQH